MQLSDIPNKLVLPWATSGNKNNIPVASQIGITAGAASLADGFPPLTMTPVAAGGVPPSGLDMNGILYEMSAILRWANAGGGYAYDATFATDTYVGGYPKGARVMRSDGMGYWFNTVENNTTDPEAAGAAAAGWVPDYQAGATAVAMSGSSVTLTPAQYGKPLIVITGALSANLNLVFPALAQGWTVINNTTGGYSITAKTAAGSGVVLGTISQIVGDGTDIYSANPDSVQIVTNVAKLRNIAPSLSRRVQTKGYYADGDNGGGQFYAKVGAAPGTYVDNGGSIIVPNGGDGSAAWFLDITYGVTVRQFGAKGDSTNDDTSAFQNAINFVRTLRDAILFVPQNNPAQFYKITAPLVITGAISIVGAGQNATNIMAFGFTSGQYILDFDCLAADVIYHVGLSNLTLRSDNGNAVATRLKNVSYVTMKQVQFYSTLKGVEITGTTTFSNFFEEVTGYNIGLYTIHFVNFAGGGQYMFNGCTFSGLDGVVVQETAATDALTFQTCNFEQCVTTSFTCYGSVNGLSFLGCRTEGLNGLHDFLVEPTAGNSVHGLIVTGCTFSTDNGNSNPVSLGGVVKGFSITGNNVGYAALIQFVRLNGTGESGVIAGNYLANAPKVVDAPRAGIVVFANSNSSGALADYWGVANWKVEQSTFVATATGMTTAPTGTVKYSVVGNTVTLDLPTITGTSNATSFTLTGGPVAIRPAVDKDIIVRLVDNDTMVMGLLRVKTTGVIELYASISGNVFTATGTKSLASNSITYTLA